jgi:hypothetical protein
VILNCLCVGSSPPEALVHLCSASLLAIHKKGGSLRPIAIGEVLRRLVSTCIVRAVHSTSTAILSPLQVGVGVPGVSQLHP